MTISEPCGGSGCPIDATVKLISRKWVVAIIKDMYQGKSHFNEFKENKPTLTNAVLSDTLKFMEKNGLIEKIIHDNNQRSNTEYVLTDKSRKLNKIIYELAVYGIEVLHCDNPDIEKCLDAECQELRKAEFKEMFDIDVDEKKINI